MKDYKTLLYLSNKVHNQKNLTDYDLFQHQKRKYIYAAFKTDPDTIILLPKKDQQLNIDEIFVAEIDYDNFIYETNSFGFKQLNKVVVKEDSTFIKIECTDCDFLKNYCLFYKDEATNVILDINPGGILDKYFAAINENDFGVRIYDDSLKFKVWSPPAARIELLFFNANNEIINSDKVFKLEKKDKGVWTTTIKKEQLGDVNFDKIYYQYVVYAYGKVKLALDPYAFSMQTFSSKNEDKIGKAAIIDLKSEKSGKQNEKIYSNITAMANENDLIAYETHIRDFCIDPEQKLNSVKGTFSAFAEKVSYLKNLGVTHVQLMPVMSFYTVNEKDKSFSDKEAKDVNYNWGYDPLSFFSLSGWYSSDVEDPYFRIKEFRLLVNELHKNKIGVILDVVYNHTHIVETFENIAPGCYYRFTSDLKISGHTGAGPSIESRHKMIGKFIIDSLKHWINEYHIDGFRFDLMSFTDHETMDIIRKEAGEAYLQSFPNALILHGEAWVFSDLNTSPHVANKNAAVTKINYPDNLWNFGMFNDIARDAIGGKHNVRGLYNGNLHAQASYATVVTAGLKGFNPGPVPYNKEEFLKEYYSFSDKPSRCVNFISVHDGLTFWDKLNLQLGNYSLEIRARFLRKAMLMLFTSQGKIVLNSGEELFRSKPLSDFDIEANRAYTSDYVQENYGTKFFHENSYCSADFTNMIRWSNLNIHEVVESVNYLKELILIRRSIPALRMTNEKNIKKGLKFITNNKIIAQVQPCNFTSFYDDELSNLKIRFINGPRNEIYYLCGEVHPKANGDNPSINKFYVPFNSEGVGEIVFQKSDIQKFDLTKWGNPNLLDIKLVKTPGDWDTIKTAYSETGNNIISCKAINKEGEVELDLSIRDCKVGIEEYEPEGFMAWHLDNSLEKQLVPDFKKTPFSELLIIHNFSEKEQTIEFANIENPELWKLLADTNRASINTIEIEDDILKIEKNKVTIAEFQSVILAKVISD